MIGNSVHRSIASLTSPPRSAEGGDTRDDVVEFEPIIRKINDLLGPKGETRNLLT